MFLLGETVLWLEQSTICFIFMCVCKCIYVRISIYKCIHYIISCMRVYNSWCPVCFFYIHTISHRYINACFLWYGKIVDSCNGLELWKPLSLAPASHCDKEAIRQGSSIGHLTSIRIDHQVCGKAPFQGWLCCSTQILEKWNRTNLERELWIFAFENQVKWSPWGSIRTWLLQKIFLWTLCSIHSIYCRNGWFY